MSNDPALHSVFIFLWKRTMLKLVANNSPLSQPGFPCNQESGCTVVCWQIGSCYEDNEGIKLLCTPSPWKQRGSCRQRVPGFYLCLHVCVICEQTSPRACQPRQDGSSHPFLASSWCCTDLLAVLLSACQEVTMAKSHSPERIFLPPAPIEMLQVVLWELAWVPEPFSDARAAFLELWDTQLSRNKA